tara:strand:+ start:1519 stop:2457 length:939 start_codon:yes stop_codon:yes gene_type:complete
MTYKDIINRFRTITEDHLMLEDFGYGDLTDLKYVSQLGSEEERVQYPYLYLLPSSSTRNGPVMQYAFNMIIMDMARPEDGPNTDKFDNYITIQSQCQQYIDDVLAQLYYFYKDQPEIELTGITYTPFKEKYQDVLAGMTATINIAVPTPLNECIAPFDNWVLDTSLPIITNDVQDYSSNSFGSRRVVANFNIPTGPTRYRIDLDLDFTVNYDLAPDPAPWNVPVITVQQDGGETPVVIRTFEFNGEIRTLQNVRESFEVTLSDSDGNNDLLIAYGWSTLQDLPGIVPATSAIAQSGAVQGVAGSVKIYTLAP